MSKDDHDGTSSNEYMRKKIHKDNFSAAQYGISGSQGMLEFIGDKEDYI